MNNWWVHSSSLSYFLNLQADESDVESVAAVGSQPPPIYTTKVAQMTRASTSVSSTPAVSTTSHSELQSLSSSDEGSLIEGKENEFIVRPNKLVVSIFNLHNYCLLFQPEPVTSTKHATIDIIDDNLSKISEESGKISISSTLPTPEISKTAATYILEEQQRSRNQETRPILASPTNYFSPIKQDSRERTNATPVEGETDI